MIHRHSHNDYGRRYGREERSQSGIHLGHDRHGRQGRGGGLGRLFAHGDLRLVILHLIAEKPRHGYEIIKAMKSRLPVPIAPVRASSIQR